MIIENREALLKEREAAREELASYKCRILVCAGTGCVASGSEKIYQKMVELCARGCDAEHSMCCQCRNIHSGRV